MPSPSRVARPILPALLLLAAAACTPGTQRSFESPDAAMQEIAASIGSGDVAWVESCFGPGSLELFRSGDEVADRGDAARVKEMILERVAFEEPDETTRIALLGADEWPFPIPLVREADRWRFDTDAGREELLNRRIGRNELLTLATLHECVEAQREYAASGRDGNPRAHAQRFASSEGRHDGLYWPVEDGEPPSPLGALVARAAEDGQAAVAAGDGPPAFRGYRYRILTRQGPSAPGGERSYLDENGLMTGGFAVVAWPAEPGRSGVMTFLVNHQGIVFEKDLTASGEAPEAIASYDPDESWRPTAD